MADEAKRGILTIGANAPKKGRDHFTEYNFGNNIKEAVDIHAEDVVYSLYLAKGVIAIQDKMRGMMNKDLTTDAIDTAFEGYKLGVVAIRTGSEDKFVERFLKMTPDKQAEVLGRLKEKAAAAKG